MTPKLKGMILMSPSILNLNPERLRVMKKIYIAMAVLGTVALVSCEREKSFDDMTPIGENGIAFVLQKASTRSMEMNAQAPVQKGISFPMGVDANGDAIFLEETIENLNPGPATKGAPAYTINVGTLYPTMGVYADGKFGDAAFEVMDMYDHKDDPSDPTAPTTAGPDNTKGDGWRYHHNYNGSPWPTDKDEKVDFYLRMPAESPAQDFDYTTKGSIAFDYTSTASGKAQQDILFTHTAISKNEHDGYLPNGAPVLMYHALTGVKFRSGSSNDHETKTIITKVEFTGLKGAGHCVITPASSSVVWSNLGAGPQTFYMEFKNQEYSTAAGVDGTVTYTSGENNKFGDSWYSAAADRNLNNENGELTFWFIPQEITNDVKLKVTFCVKTPDTADEDGGGYETHEIDFGELVNKGRTNPLKWEAGQLRTYTLNPKLVDVEIYDSMVNLTKSGLHVTNTGNVNEFVRMMVIGNWYGWASQDDADANKEPMILVGYTHADPSNTEMVKPWFREDEEYGSYFDDTFKGGKPVASAGNEWIFGTGSYFYYPNSLGPDTQLAASSSLFQSYTLPANKIPTIYIPTSASSTRVQAVGVHLVMEVVIQAIDAHKPNSEELYTDWKEAWSAATGEEIGVK